MITPRLHHAPSVLRALDQVLSSTGFPCASNWHLFKDAQFGRDALEVAEDLLLIRPEIARRVIERLAELQGRSFNPHTEEEPGKIHHEHRALIFDGRPIDAPSAEMFWTLVRHWYTDVTPEVHNGTTEFTVYTTVDATPLFVRLVARYCEAYGCEILDSEYTPHSGVSGAARPTIRDSVRAAIGWIDRRIAQSSLGLLEFQRMSPRGGRFQAWKDGSTSYIHPDGNLANFDAPIASIEVQGLAHDALIAACRLLSDAPEEDRQRWAKRAASLRDSVIQLFWMPDQRYFAMAIDRDPVTGVPRQLASMTSNPGALLDSGLFDTLREGDRTRYVSEIVKHVFGSDFLTPAGIRCSSLVHQSVQDYAAYQSSYTVWHKETYDIARGLERQGLWHLARELENRMLNAVNVSGGPTEFLYVMPDNRVDYSPLRPNTEFDAEDILGTNVPENDQAWSISAAVAIKWRRGHPEAERPVQEPWQIDLEERVLGEIAGTRVLATHTEIEKALPRTYAFRIDTHKGFERENAYLRRYR